MAEGRAVETSPSQDRQNYSIKSMFTADRIYSSFLLNVLMSRCCMMTFRLSFMTRLFIVRSHSIVSLSAELRLWIHYGDLYSAPSRLLLVKSCCCLAILDVFHLSVWLPQIGRASC